MPRRNIILAAVCLATLAQPALAQDEVYTRRQEKPFKGQIKQESAKGVVVTGVKELIPAEEILEIFYEVTPLLLNAQSYRPAFLAEKDLDSKDPKKVEKHKENLLDAIKKYEETAAKAESKEAKRHCEYKSAWLRARQANEEGTAPESVISRLQEYAKKHPDSWQITRVLQRLASMQIHQKDYEGAEASYQTLSELALPEELKQEAQLNAATVFLRMDKGKKDGPEIKKYLEAQKKVQALAVGQAKDSRFGLRLKIAEAECQGKAGQVKEATAALRGLIKDTADKGLKAAAYNALGVTFYDAGQSKDARWEFLWVDVVYNLDKTEHSRALFYLAKIFDELGESDRAQDCRQLLLESREFLGLEYQRLAQRLAAPAKAP